MSFPNSPTNGQQATVGNVSYQYSSANNTWTRIPGNVIVASVLTVQTTANVFGNLTAGNIISSGYFYSNGTPFIGGGGGGGVGYTGSAGVGYTGSQGIIGYTGSAGSGGGGIDTIDAGTPYSVYGGLTALDGGGVT